tara:strand:+ start:659 stop:1036 length:378 start_codon:yes stop_codon:yes gene_type:complete
MIKRLSIALMVFPFLMACYQPQRDCAEFTNGSFTFTSTIDGIEATTKFIRQGDLEIDYFNGKADSSSVRWINNCEYIVKKLNPKNRAEEQSVHMKILSTTDKSYTFEYNLVGNSKKSRGTAFKTD